MEERLFRALQKVHSARVSGRSIPPTIKREIFRISLEEEQERTVSQKVTEAFSDLTVPAVGGICLASGRIFQVLPGKVRENRRLPNF